MYADHFRRWLAVFPSNFVLVVKSDSLYGDSKVRAAEWREVLCVCVCGGGGGGGGGCWWVNLLSIKYSQV